MAGMGPPPKDPSQRARRNATVAMIRLPAAGRTGRMPAWPLPADVVQQDRLKVLRAQAKDLEEILDVGEHSAKKAKELEQELLQLVNAIAVLDAQIKAARKYEGELWRSLWKTPMAVMWEKLAWTREVALYVRWQVRAELGDIKASSDATEETAVRALGGPQPSASFKASSLPGMASQPAEPR